MHTKLWDYDLEATFHFMRIGIGASQHIVVLTTVAS